MLVLRGFAVVFFLTAAGAYGDWLSQDEARRAAQFGWSLPSEFTNDRLKNLISEMAHRTQGKAFRTLGVKEDWDHGHVLFEAQGEGESRRIRPRAILYHTQEEASKYHWEGPADSPYRYLDVTTRNWIQWLSDSASEDGAVVENARTYLDVTKKDPVQFFDEKTGPVRTLRYTIHAKELDDKKLGFGMFAELQFQFHRECNQPIDTFYRRGPITVEMPDGSSVCLVVNTGSLIERSFWTSTKPKRPAE